MRMLAVLGITVVALVHVAFAGNPSVTPDVLDMLRATGQDEKLAELLGIQDVSLLHPNMERSEDPLLSNVSPLGDILLTEEQLEQARQGLNFGKYTGSKWRNNAIPYYVNPNDFTTDQQNQIHNALTTLNNRLQRLDIRRYRNGDNDYVWIFSGNGCYSNLGRVGGGQTVSLQRNGCVHTGIIQHELIHAAGMQHEHNRPDRDNFIRVIKENIPPEWQSQYEKGSYDDYVILGRYDYDSVMHYGYYAPGTNKPAFDLSNRNVDSRRLGQRRGPTDTDIQKIDKLYG